MDNVTVEQLVEFVRELEVGKRNAVHSVDNDTSAIDVRYDEKVVTAFISSYISDSLWVSTIDNAVVIDSVDNLDRGDNRVKMTLLIKQKRPVTSMDQIDTLTFPTSDSGDVGMFDQLRGIINQGLLPIFEGLALQNKYESESFVALTRKKFNELSLSLQNLQESVQVPDLLLSVHPAVAHFPQETNEFPDDLVNDSIVLNEVTAIVNSWIKQIQAVTNLSSDLASQSSIVDEIQFWSSMDISLTSIESQLNNPQVKNSVNLLNRAKRFHITLSFKNDTNLSTRILETKLNLFLLKDIPIDDLTKISYKDPHCLETFDTSVSNIFNHLKRLRTINNFPLDKALMIIELILKDILSKLIDILDNYGILLLDINDFLSLHEYIISTIFMTIDINVKFMVNLIRELLRKRQEKFFAVRINQDNVDELREKLDNVKRLRVHHTSLVFIVRNFLQDGDQETKLIEEYNRLAIVSPFEFSKHGNLLWSSGERNYRLIQSNIQSIITDKLNNLFSDCIQFSDYVSVADRYRYITSESNFDFLNLMKEDLRLRILDAAKIELDNLERFIIKNGSQTIKAIQQQCNKKQTIARVNWLLTIKDKLKFYQTQLQLLVGTEWQKYSTGNKLNNRITSISSKVNLEEIYDSVLDEVSQYFLDNKFQAKGKLLSVIDTQKGSDIVLNFKEKSIDYKEIIHFFVNKGFKVPISIQLQFQKFDKLLPIINDLSEKITIVQHIFNNTFIKDYGKKYELLIEEDKKNLKSLFNDMATVDWEFISQALDIEDIEQDSNLIEVRSFNIVQDFQSVADDFIRKTYSISKLDLFLSNKIYYNLRTCKFDFHSIHSILEHLFSTINDNYEFLTISALCSMINNDISQILSQRCNEQIVSFSNYLIDKNEDDQPTSSYFPLVEASLSFKDQIIQMDPCLNSLKANLFEFANTITATVEQQQVLQNSFCHLEKDFMSNSMLVLYSSIEQVLSSINDYSQSWKHVCSLTNLDLQSEDDIKYLAPSGSLEEWLHTITDVINLRPLFDTPIKKLSNSVIFNLDRIQSKLSLRFDNFQKDLIKVFGSVFQHEVQVFDHDLLETMKLLNFNTLDSVNFLENITNYLQLKSKISGEWKTTKEQLNKSVRVFLKFNFQFPPQWIFIDQIENKLSILDSILERKETIIQQQYAFVKSTIELESKTLLDCILRFKDDWAVKKPIEGDKDILMVLNLLNNMSTSCSTYKDSSFKIRSISEHFDIKTPQIDDNILLEISNEIQDLIQVWTSINSIYGELGKLKNIQWTEVKPREIRLKLEHLLEQCRSLPIKVRQYSVFDELQQTTKLLIKQHKYLVDLKNENMKDRHWKKLLETLGIQNKRYHTLLLGDIWGLDLALHESLIRAITSQANNENTIEENILKIKQKWTQVTFEFFNFNNKIQLIKSWDGLFEHCRQDLNELSSMKNSESSGAFESDIVTFEGKLNSLFIILDVFIEVQKQWVYLHGVFTSTNNITTILPLESSRFNNLSFEFFELFRKIYKIDLVLDLLLITDIETSLDKLLDSFGRLRRSLSDYLEKQRDVFPRFYFLGNEDLLELIGSGKNFDRINKHVSKLFSGVANIDFDTNSSSIIAVSSSEGERMQILEPVSLIQYPSLIDWLLVLEREIKLTLSQTTKNTIPLLEKLYSAPDLELLKHILDTTPSQVINLCCQITFTRSLETIDKQSDLVSRIKNILNILADINKDCGTLQKKITEGMIIDIIHQRNIACEIIMSPDNRDCVFDGELLYYYDNESSDLLEALKVKQFNFEFTYGFEYVGVMEKLVFTPLMSKCYLAMTQAVAQKQGGSPFGPAGTGKTEAIKALGHSLGKMVTVFCCDQTFDFQAVNRIFLGICKVGCWGCFDEFNRLDEKLLSAVSSQIESIELGLRDESKKVELSDKSITINPETGLFVTMNPGYVGRNELPENLKKLFRSFSMQKPDKEIIVDVLLTTQGFLKTKELAQVVVPFFNELESLCSPQTHYDFGLRALKAMLNNCGKIKRKTKKALSEKDELAIVLRSIYDTTLPKLVKEDQVIFFSLKDKYFPDIHPDNNDYSEFMANLKEYASKHGLCLLSGWVQKTLQLYHLQQNHHGIMLVGESGTGKTECCDAVLRSLYKTEGKEHTSYRIDAKVLAKHQIFGHLDAVTREWTDGLFTGILRKIRENLRGEMNKECWIIFDGDIDPEWAENLNSVLDDNKALTLPNGEKLGIPPNLRIIFETDNLKYTTLATISRCSMIWFDDSIIEDYALFEKLVFDLKSENIIYNQGLSIDTMTLSDYQNKVSSRVHDIVKPDVLQQVTTESKKLDHIMVFSLQRYIFSFGALMKSYMRKILDHAVATQTNIDSYKKYIDKAILLSLVWSFAGDTELTLREEFGKALSSFNAFSVIDIPEKPVIDYDISLPGGTWISWENSLTYSELDPNQVAKANTVISTLDTVRHESFVQAVMNEHRPLLLCGPPGSGKTMILLEFLKKSPNLDILQLNFSKDSSPLSLMNSLKQHCEYRKSTTGKVFAPKLTGKWVVVFCDEINLPGTDKFGTQKVISFMRQMIENDGFWDPHERQWIKIERIQFVGACNSPKDPGRHALGHRFLRHVSLLMVDYPGVSSLHQIYETFNRAVMKCVPDLRGYTDSVTHSMINVYLESKEKFKPSMQSHYVYSPRELTRWCRGLLNALTNNDFKDLPSFVRMWYHEGLRLFYDRLIFDSERQWTKDLFKATIEQHFPFIDIADVVKEPIFFSDWLSLKYELVSKDDIQQFLSHRLGTFCEEEIDVDLVFYEGLLDHALRIYRVLQQPQGHMILVGPPTTGKTTLTKFVAWMNGLKTIQLYVKSGYTVNDFDKTLRHILLRCVKGEHVCFVINESSIIETSFIERMNTLLANSEIPGLFTGDDYRELMRICLEESQVQGLFLDSDDEIYSWFSQQVSMNLHVVFTVNELNGEKRLQAVSSPALFNRCVLNYMGDWAPDTLTEVGSKLVQGLPIDMPDHHIPPSFEPVINKPITTYRDIIINSIIYIHNSMLDWLPEYRQDNSVAKFLTFINNFVSIFSSKSFDMEENQRHTTNGLNKLRETVLQVGRLKEELSAKQLELNKRDKEARDMLDVMLSRQNEAERKQEFSITAQEELNKQEHEIETKKQSVIKDLQEAEPALVEAKKGVQNIKKQHLTEIRSMGNPPEAVKLTMESVCILVGYDVSSWRDVQLAIRKDDFIPSLVSYDNEEQLTNEIRHYMEETYLSRPDYNFETVNRASKACGPLVQWVKAQLLYHSVLKNVDPLKEELTILENGARKTKAQIRALQQMVVELEESIEEYKRSYSSLIRNTEHIKTEMETVELKVNKSLRLIENLTSEKDRWKNSIAKFSDERLKIPGDSLLAAAFLTYSGIYDQRVREELIEKWRKCLQDSGINYDKTISILSLYPSNDKFSLEDNFNDTLDELTKENMLILKLSKFPLLIDPSSESIHLLTRQLKSKVMVTSFLAESFVRDLENAVRFGGLLIVKDSEYYNPVLDTVLRGEAYKNGGRMLITIGDQSIDYNPEFKLFLHTRDPSPVLNPFIRSRVSIVNFTLTSRSLESNVLDLALKETDPETENKRATLVTSQNKLRKRLKKLEVQLLDSLSDVSGNVLDDDKVIDYLEKLKTESREIDSQIEQSEVVLKKVDVVRNKFFTVALHCSLIFNILKELSQFSSFYNFQLQICTKVFLMVLNTFKDSLDDDTDLIVEFYKEIYAIVSHSLTGLHKIVFGIALTTNYYNIDIGQNFTKFFRHLLDVFAENRPIESLPPVVEQLIIDKLVDINNMEEIIHNNGDNLILQKLSKLITASMRMNTNPSAVINEWSNYASFLFTGVGSFSSKYDIEYFVDQSPTDSVHPIVLSSVEGFDATFKVEHLSKTKNQNLTIVSLGTKEGISLAKKELQAVSSKGEWLLVQNIQMSNEWIQNLEKLLDNLDAKPSFRLFLTCNIESKVPVALITKSQVLAYENQPTLKNIFMETFATLPDSILTSKPPEYRHIYFLFTWFHCIIVHRMRYTPVSFTKKYDINDSDFNSGMVAIDNLLAPLMKGSVSNISLDRIPWQKISYLIGEITYGGKIDNTKDSEYVINLSRKLFTIEGFENDFNLVGNTITNKSGIKVYRPDGIALTAYKEWINDLPNETPLSWIELQEDVNDLMIKNDNKAIASNGLRISLE